MSLNTVKVPTREQLGEVAAELGFSFTEADLAAHHEACCPPSRRTTSSIGCRTSCRPSPIRGCPAAVPLPEENRHGAWYVKTEVEGAAAGKLKGKKIALKDNICLAGVPMMNGASTMEGYVPDVDATVVTRILDAGGTIVGKTVCEYFCFSGGSHTSASGPVHNPHRMGYSAGGSSSGSATVVGLGRGADGIGRRPGRLDPHPSLVLRHLRTEADAWSGALYRHHADRADTSITPGPMTATVEDNALLLEVLAGPDGLDPRQYGGAVAKPYREAFGRGAAGLRIAVVEEGFGHSQTMPQVDAIVREAAERFKGLGATVDTVSIPMHRLGSAIWLPVAAEGATMQMMLGNGFGFNWQGLYVTSMLDFHSAWRNRADELSDSLKNTMLLGHYMVTRYRGHYYAKAQNLVRRLRRAYDEVLARYDLLLMPTLPMVATPLPEANAPVAQILQRAFEMLANTAQFDCTHHPAMSLPCGLVDGLPVGMMLVAKAFDEETIYRAAAAFENGVDWKSLKAG